MRRGDVYLVDMPLPERANDSGGVRRKLVLCLQDAPIRGGSGEVAVLVCSSWRGRALGNYELLLSSGDGFQHDTVIDARWPYTVPAAVLADGRHLFSISDSRMSDVSLALVNGLEIR